MPTINSTILNNNCYNDRSSSITISQIIFSSSELETFSDYILQWSGDIDGDSIISNDKRVISNLINGSYFLNIVSLVDNSIIGPYTFSITSPEQLSFKGVQSTPYSCNNNGSIFISIDGGVPPYNYILNTITHTSSNKEITINNLEPGNYTVSVADANNCSIVYNTELEILDSIISISNIITLSPTKYDDFGYIEFQLDGIGPFGLSFINNSNPNNNIILHKLETKYIASIQNNSYLYKIDNLLRPGTYGLIVTTDNCSLVVDNIQIPNINPMTVSLDLTSNQKQNFFSPQICLPFYDTILIPYKHIASNSNLWNLIKTFSLKDSIHIKVNGIVSELFIVRNMLDKYGLDNNKIEILRLGNNSSDWFYYFYIAPGFNPENEPEILSSDIKIVDPNTQEEFDLILGLTEDNTIDTQNASVIRGSFILSGPDHSQFVSLPKISSIYNRADNIYVSIGEPDIPNNYEYVVKKSNKSLYKNLYQLDYVTTLNFLEQFNVLNQYVNINQTACNTNQTDYQYILNIKQLLIDLNNRNNISQFFVYNLDNSVNTGSVRVNISGNNNFNLLNEQIENSYTINYYSIDTKSTQPKPFVRNDNIINSNTLDTLDSGYIIIRIKDRYNNTPLFVDFNNIVESYDDHFTSSKNILQKYNPILTDQFHYGDILIYISSGIDTNVEGLVSPPPPQEPQNTTLPYDTIEQTKDTTNTSSLLISINSPIKHWLYGPKNYKQSFNRDTLFTNLLSGLYIISGDTTELQTNQLYQKEYRILIDPNTENDIYISFDSYKDQVLIRDN